MYSNRLGTTNMNTNGSRTAAAMHTLYTHPFSFALGIGLANGLLAVSRDKRLDMPVTVTLAVILGLGEMAIEAFIPPEERHHSLPAIGLYSVLGVAVGIAPFMWWSRQSEERARGMLIASRETESEPATAGW